MTMMDVDNHIQALLSDGPKRFTELLNALVPKICARGTLSTHLKNLEKDHKIKKKLFDDRTVQYSLIPKHLSSAKSARDIISLESLILELEYKTRKELTLEEVRPEKNQLDWLDRLLEPTKNRPKMIFRIHLDKDTLKIVNLIEPTSKFASNLEKTLREKIEEIKLNVPATIQREYGFLHTHRTWSDIKEFSRKVALKHGMRFLVVSWYDGKEYKDKIMSALRRMEKLERNHEEDIYFLEETDRRCFYSDYEYYYEVALILEVVTSSLLYILDPRELIEEAFWRYFWREQELARLEAALISGSASKLPKNSLKEEWKRYEKEIRSPYKILSFKAYVRMKLPFLDNDERKFLIRDLLEKLKIAGEDVSPDFQLHPKDYRLAIDLLLEKLGDGEKSEAQANIQSPILNFQFYDGQRRIDFSDEPLVKNFSVFKKDPKKRKWLQKCLLLGFPIFLNIPFDKLGFEVKNIL